ncbi:MAG: uvrD [Proteobacteria bacterium]|nr:uvrD [Pseudomonadota bacterium]
MTAPHPLLVALNDAQRAAVSAPLAPTLVLAGAGSGKTRVLTHRAAWLIEEQGVAPQGLLAVTFTNKAASEMRGRIESLLHMPSGALWIGTFHGIAHRLLRRHWRESGLPQHFQILDDDDQQRLVRKLLKEQNLDEQRWVPREVQGFINREKDEGRRPKHLQDRGDPTRRELIRLYDLYQRRCDQLGVVDFAELLLRSYEVIRDQPQLADFYRHRFRHVLVDEFQDTNSVQYDWIKLVCGKSGTPFVVGDDDQSIYRWRGARVENMQHFRRDFGATVFKLEQNYRSTGVILGAANEVIRRNEDRLGKELWTEAAGGEPIRLYAAFNERDEADFVIERIREHARSGRPLAAAAVLYRSNAQSRSFEEALMAARIPYRVYGGLRFFERAEIKDALAYLRLTQNRSDDVSFERVVNLPTRGIGQSTLDRLRETARAGGTSLWNAAQALLPVLPARAATALNGFIGLIDRLASGIGGLELHEQVRRVIEDSGLREHHAKEKDTRGEARVENLDELVNAAEGFTPEVEDELPLLASFLAHATLESGETQAAEGRDCVQLMTLHSAKGLEFPTVFMVGMEEGLFPSERSVFDPEKLPEERRLCYVGITRAMQRLYLSHAESRRIYGRTEYRAPSRFLAELPAALVEEVRPRLSVSRPLYDPSTRHGGPRRHTAGPEVATAVAPARRQAAKGEELPIRLGARVRHPKFGEGVVLRYEGNGDTQQVQVNFENAGQKWLMYAYAKLEAV